MGRHTANIKDEEIEQWLEDVVEKGKYRSKSHAFESGLRKLKEEDENNTIPDF